METKIRQGVFETNSSSSHSISFNPWVPGKTGNNLVPEGDGVIRINGDEFGWGWDKYNDAESKANYYLERYGDDPDRLELLKEVIEGFTGHPVEINENSGGYIDHQSWDTLDLPAGSSEAVKDFIFNPDVWLYIGNDNSEEPNGFRNDEIIGISGGNVNYVTIHFENGENLDLVLPEFPSEENLSKYIGSVEFDYTSYNLESFDLENMELIFSSWDNTEELKAKIVKIKSDELGEVI